MDEAIQVQKHILVLLRVRSLVAQMRRRTVSSLNWLVSLSGKAKVSRPLVRRANDMIPSVGIIVGAVAFGFWWSSFAAGLFACLVLFFLAGIYKTTGRIVAAVLTWECERMAGTAVNWEASAMADQSHRNTETIDAIERLQSWVANETSPTEEDVKASCAVLLESVTPDTQNKRNRQLV